MSKRNNNVMLLLFTALLIAATISFLRFQNYNSGEKVDTRAAPLKSPQVHFGLGDGLDLVMVPFKEGCEILVSESPVANAQYAAAVAERGAPAPELPDNLRAGARKVNPDLPASVNPPPWEQVAWRAGIYPHGQAGNAVLFVTVDEAMAYCAWLEKKIPSYEFRLPNKIERKELETERGMPNRRLAEGESAFPRPISGPGAIRVKGRFWMAPYTHEICPFEPVFYDDRDDDFKAVHELLYPGRYVPIIGGSFGTATVIPTTFRVVAIKKRS